MYPMLNEGVSLGTFRNKISEECYYVENQKGDSFEIDRELYDALMQADGRCPISLFDSNNYLFDKLKRDGIIHTSRFIHSGGIINRFVLFLARTPSQKCKRVCKVINVILPIVGIILFTMGLFLLVLRGVSVHEFNWFLYYGILVVSISLHEIGHLIAGIAYGYKICDVGILLLVVIPFGAYVGYEERTVGTRKEIVQFSLAGIEMNLLIAGLCLAIGTTTAVAIANLNVFLVIINILPGAGFDGEAAWGAIFGIEGDLSVMARKWLQSRDRRRRLLEKGVVGYIWFLIFTICLLSKYILLGIVVVDLCIGLISILA